MLALVVRGAKVLARPADHPQGPVPSVDEVTEFASIIESFDYETVRVVKSSTGSPPEGWRWVLITDLQSEASSIVSDAVGEALVCGG